MGAQHWAGLDWSDASHAVCVVDAMGKPTATFTVPQSEEGLIELLTRLQQVPGLAGIALEACRHLVVQVLSAHGFTVYPINPKVSAAWREGWSVSAAKSDFRDAQILADGLRHHQARLRPLTPDTPAARTLALLCEDEMAFIQERTALVNKLKATIKLYYPAALAWFDDWTTPTAWDFIRQFPTPRALAAAPAQTLYAFLKTHHLGLRPAWQKCVREASHATALAADEATEHAMALRAVTLAEQLHKLQAALHQYRTEIDQLLQERSDAALFTSLPGAGEKLAPRLVALWGEDRRRLESAQVVQLLTGTAPVQFQSGRTVHTRFRWACAGHLRNTMHMFAWCSLRRCAWARTFYQHRRQQGDSHALALRKLAFKWIKIIFAMWRENRPYDERRYLLSLHNHGSHLIDRLPQYGG